MADDSGASGADASQEPGAGDAIQKAMSGMVAGMSTAEKVIALGLQASVKTTASRAKASISGEVGRGEP